MKAYLAEEHDEEGRAYYPEFSIDKANGKYRLPTVRTERLKALDKLLATLRAHEIVVSNCCRARS